MKKLLILVLLYLTLFLIDIIPKKCEELKCEDPVTVDALLPTLKFVPDWFVRSYMIKKLDDDLFADHDILFLDEDSGNVKFSSDKMAIFSVDLNNIKLDDVNSDEDDPEAIIHIRPMAWHNILKQLKECKKYISKGLMPVA